MAGQFMTLQEILEQAYYRADLEGLFDRHPTTNVIREVNHSWRHLRVKLANNDCAHILSPTTITTLPVVEAVSGGGYAEIDWPTNFVSVHGLDVKVGGYWCTVPQGNFTQRRLGPLDVDRGDYRYADDGLATWIVRTLPTTSGATTAAGKIMLFPVPSGGSYVLWGLTEWIDITVSTDVFPGQESWINWAIWDTACKMLIRDIGPQVSAQLQKCEEARERVWLDIKTNTQRLANDGPIEPMSRYSRFGGRGPRLLT